MKPITQALLDNYHWLKERNLIHPDVLIDQLASPELSIGGKPFVSFSSNNYLGLSRRPEVLQASKEALLKYTNGTSESRKLGGNLRVLEDLEHALSQYKSKEDTMIFATGLMANVGIIPAITDVNLYMQQFYDKPNPGSEPVIIGDQLNHRSIQMGVKLSHAKPVRYDHADMNDLEQKLEDNNNSSILIVTDSVFSMDGDLAPLDKITELADRYNAAVMIDDAHGSGVFGKNGRGASEHFGVTDKIDFLMGTLSKAFGGIGGFVSAKKEIIDMLKVNTDTYYFTSSLTADSAAGLIAAIKIASAEEQLRVNLWNNVHRLLRGLFELGVDVPLRFSQIVPIMIYDEAKAYGVEEFLYDHGVLCSAITVPAVAHGKERLRVSVNASHTFDHIDKFLDLVGQAVSRFDIPVNKRSGADWDAFIEASPDYIVDMVGLKVNV